MKKNISNHKPTIPKSIHELNIILKINQSIIETLDYEKAFQVISNGMSELLEIETAAIYVLENEDTLYLGATTPPLDPNMPNELRSASVFDHPHIKQTIESRLPLFLSDTTNCELSVAEKLVVELRQLKSLLYLPFVQKDRVLGVLILGTCRNERFFSQHEIDLGQTIANQLSVALQNAKLHVDLKNHKENLEKLVSEKTKDLDTAIEVLKATNEELNLKNENIKSQNQKLEMTLKDLKETQSQLIQSEKLASIGVLTAGLAHEINNPLNYILGAYFGLESYFQEYGHAEEEQIQFLLQGLKKGVENASKIVQALNQYSRESSTFNESCDLNAILDNCLLILHHQLGDHIQVIKKYQTMPVIIPGNIGKIHQALLNILINATQAIEKEGQIIIKTFTSSHETIIEIIDTGCGISIENLTKITDPFFTTKDPGQGTGLGLFITYNIVNDHKGKIEFESEPCKGTTVRVIFPS